MLVRLAVAALLLALTACGQSNGGSGDVGGDPVSAPKLGACRLLVPADIGRPNNNTPPVRCTETHTAQTFAVGTFPESVTKGASVTSPELGAYIYKTCSQRFDSFLGGDESSVMRSLLTWAWFRPTEKAWKAGARWYRCDVVSGSEHSEKLRPLPKDAKLLLGAGVPDDKWMTCANGKTVADSVKVPCSQPHTWRAVTTIKVGRDEDPYPGDHLVQVRTRDFCSDSVGAWMNYPVDYDFGYTYFRRAEWKAGNRRSICWAKTTK